MKLHQFSSIGLVRIEEKIKYLWIAKYQLYLIGDHLTGLATTKLTNKAAESFLRDVLLNKQLRIEIWKNNRNEWQVIRKASPGNLQDVEDFLFSSTQMTSAPVVIAIKYGASGDNKVWFYILVPKKLHTKNENNRMLASHLQTQLFDN